MWGRRKKVPKPAIYRSMVDLLAGAHVLLGLTYLKHDGMLDRREQIHGWVKRVDSTGVFIRQ